MRGLDRNEKILVVLIIALKLFAGFFIAYSDVWDVGRLLDISREKIERNWKILGYELVQRPLIEKLGYSFDSISYVGIARQGYSTSFDDSSDGLFVAYTVNSLCLYNWPPLYPLMIWFAAGLLGYLPAGLFVSNLASLAAVIAFYRVATEFIGCKKAFYGSVLLMAYSYNVMSFLSAYSEPVYLVFSILSWREFTRKRYFSCGLLCLAAALTRYVGLMLFPIYSVLYLMEKKFKFNRGILKDLTSMNWFLAGVYLWMFPLAKYQIGYFASEIMDLCYGRGVFTGLGFLTNSIFGLSLLYFAVLGAYYLKDIDARLSLFSFAFLVFHIAVFGPMDSIGRYIGVIWPLFIYFGNRFDRTDVVFFPSLLYILGWVVLVLHSNLVGLT